MTTEKTNKKSATIKTPAVKGRRWCFTWNNYTEDTCRMLADAVPDRADYIIFGKEIAPETNTPHLQGYVEFGTPLAMSTVKSRLDTALKGKSPIHIALCKGTQYENMTYCIKDGNFLEYGKPKEQGSRSDWRTLYDFIQANPDMGKVAEAFPEAAIRYTNGIEKLINLRVQTTMRESLIADFDGIDLRPWQEQLINQMGYIPNDRTVIWYYDEVGNTGKTWIAKYMLAKMDAAYFTGGKTSDIAHGYQGERIVIFDFSRTTEERINYQAIEVTKNGVLFSPKYDSKTKVFKAPWVVCMANFMPCISALSRDRWDIRIIKDDHTAIRIPTPPIKDNILQGT